METTSLPGEPDFFLAWPEVPGPGVEEGVGVSRALRSCRGLWWEERDGGCWTGLLPLLDHTSASRLRLNSPLLSLCGRLRLPFNVPARDNQTCGSGRRYGGPTVWLYVQTAKRRGEGGGGRECGRGRRVVEGVLGSV